MSEPTNPALKELLEKWRGAAQEQLDAVPGSPNVETRWRYAHEAGLLHKRANELEAAWPRIAAIERLEAINYVIDNLDFESGEQETVRAIMAGHIAALESAAVKAGDAERAKGARHD